MPVKQWNVGDVLSAADMNAWTVPLAVAKTADTSRNTTTTMTNDPDLILPVASGASYMVSAWLSYNGSATGTGDLKFTFTVPAGTTGGGYSFLHLGLSAGSLFGGNRQDWTATSTAGTNGTGAGNDVAIILRGMLITAGTAGNLTLQWAQNSSTATATIMRAGSYLSAQRIG